MGKQQQHERRTASPTPSASGVPVVDTQDSGALIVVSVVVLLLTVLFWLWRKRSHSRRCVLLTGQSEAGKTLIFSQLLHSQYRETFTSVKENVGEYSTDNGVLKVVDIPGQERVRNIIFDKYKGSACGIVYIIDSVTVQKDVRDDAEYLYNILSDATVLKNKPKILILCNKQDNALAKSSSIIKNLLEKEINLARNTKMSQLQSVETSQKDTQYIGKRDKDFEFSHLTTDVVIGESCAVDEANDKEANLNHLKKWLEVVY